MNLSLINRVRRDVHNNILHILHYHFASAELLHQLCIVHKTVAQHLLYKRFFVEKKNNEQRLGFNRHLLQHIAHHQIVALQKALLEYYYLL